MEEIKDYRINSRAIILVKRLIKLLGKSGNQEDAVALFLGFDVGRIVGMLGILKSGCFFTTIDIDLPFKRITYLIDDSRSKTIIKSQSQLDLIRSLGFRHDYILIIEHIDWNQDLENENYQGDADQINNLIYTSGSTGEPKGEIRTHRYLLHSCMWTGEYYSYNSIDRVAVLSSFSHGNSIHLVF